ncbi:MAG: UDP-glucose 4-epimerase [bacterium]|nr:MAG: UDP-glucose 4-epimerase [bacterium]KAF0148184.1 MAG: UDP-glucose 4-epimerase [bacterium]KAF0167699.1 MAG: UDP-glucose 4-epimerase [bacterium]TXT21092.1 MAG: UDP-glucose 4-epimerase [bacterium]
MKTILITGGAGYIGSHACVEFLEAGYDIVVLDNLCNSSAASLDRARELTGQDFPFVRGDIRDRAALDALFREHDIDAVIHFAGLKAVGESVEKPLLYYDNNIAGSVTLFEAMQAAGVRTIVFSSSATVYGDPASVPIREDFPVGGTTNPYGTSKLFIEKILQDVAIADPAWSIALLRYFNPVGAHRSGRIGEDPRGIPNNLMPYISQVAVGRREHLNVFGNDYPTPDGTGVRDYIHVVDLAQGHVKAVEKLDEGPGVRVWNLGTGCGYSVVEMAKAFEQASGRPVPYRFAPRRAGDIAQCWADPAKAERELGWKARRGLEEMCEDTWRWQSLNPKGFEGEQA